MSVEWIVCADKMSLVRGSTAPPMLLRFPHSFDPADTTEYLLLGYGIRILLEELVGCPQYRFSYVLLHVDRSHWGMN